MAPSPEAGRLAAPQPLRGRWLALAAGMMAQASVSSLQQGLPALGPVLRDSFNLSLPALGALLAATSWGVMITLYLWGRMADRLGERIVVSVGLGGAVLALLAASQTRTVLELGLAIGLAGAMSGAAIAASGRAVMGWFPRSERGMALGLRQMAVPLGAGFAAVVLPITALQFGVQAAFIALAGLAGAGVVAALLWLGPPPLVTSKPLGLATQPHTGETSANRPSVSPLRDAAIWRLSGASGLIQWSQVAMSAFLVVMLTEEQGLSYGHAALLFGLVQVLSGVMRVGAGWLSDRKGRRIPHLIAYCGVLVAALIGAALLQTGPSFAGVVVLVFATTMTYSWNGLAFAGVAELAGQGRAGAALGLHGTLMRACTLPTALLFGWAAAQVGWGMALAVLAVFPALGIILMLPLVGEEERRLAGE